MTQQSGSQFEDDLTVGIDEDETFATDSIDLLGIGGDESSPIARLKTIILSIDWEINDDILQQLDDELHDLGEIWAGDKIKQVYVQGLSKIGRYIYKEKAGAHPNSIKLLITFYHNLEKIVTNEDEMGEDEKKQLLIADVKKFDQLKSQIGKSSSHVSSTEAVVAASEEVSVVSEYTEESDGNSELKTLKALVLGIDWEINDQEIQHLGSEVKRLEGVFGQNKAKLILLQGIGALSSYINKKRSQSNSAAFSLLHSFYGSLEKISESELSAADEKQLLLSEVSKFNEFKAVIAKEATSPTAVVTDSGSTIDHGESSAEPVAALSDSPASLSDEDTSYEPEISVEDGAVTDDVNSRLSSVFGEEDEEFDGSSYKDSEKDDALAGVNVETEADDDSGEEALPYEDGAIAPALADVDEDSSFSVEKLADDLSVAPPTVKPEAIVGDDIEEEEEFTFEDFGEAEDLEEELEEVVGTDDKMQGIDVETEADDDSDEETLPMEEGELAPALSGADAESGFNADNIAAEFDKFDSEAIEDRLGSFFDDEVATSSEGWVTETSEQLLESDDRDNPEKDSIVAALSDVDEDSPVAALSDVDEDSVVAALSDVDEDSDFAAVSDADDDGIVAALNDVDEESVVQDFEDVEEVESASDDEEIEEEDESVLEDYEPAPALFDNDEETILTEESEEDLSSDESAEVAVDDGLSFLDDDIADDTAEEPEEILYEDTEAESVEESPAIPDDEEQTFAEKYEAAEEVILDSFEEEVAIEEEDSDLSPESIVEEDQQTVEEAALAFFDDDDTDIEETVEEDASPFDTPQTDDDEIAFEVESDDVEEDDEIEFTVPGDDVSAVTEEAIETVADDEEEIEFAIPGETVAPVATVIAVAATDVIEEAATIEDEGKEVVFEAVDDDVELDLLPGEEYDDSLTDDEEPLAPVVDDETVVFTEAEEVSDTGRYESLSILVAAIQDNVGEEGIQDILHEVNQLRSNKDTSLSDKTFLQLLSTVSQFIAKNRDDSHGLQLMQEIVSGLEMSDSSESSVDAVQEKLFTCTSQILLLQAKGITAQVDESGDASTQEEVTLLGGDDDTDVGSDTGSSVAKGEDEQMASFVQKELADIRKLFVEEIGSLRKELADKK